MPEISAEAIARRFDVSRQTVLNTYRRIVPPELVQKYGKYIFFKIEAIDYFNEWFIIPPEWITKEELAKKAGVKKSSIQYYLTQLPNAREYVRVFYKVGYLYNIALVGLINPRRRYVHLVRQPPDEQEWFTTKEFGDLFGRSCKSVSVWIKDSKIPAQYVQRKNKGKGCFFIHRDAIPFIDGKIIDLKSAMKDYKGAGAAVEWERLVWMDGYELTPEQHERRREIFNRRFRQE